MISVEEARVRILATASPVACEYVAVSDVCGRVLAAPLAARRTQPPVDVSAMDGYAVRGVDLDGGVTRFRVVGEAAAGGVFAASVEAGDCARIYTGAPLPNGTDTVVIQENVERDGDVVRVLDMPTTGRNVRRAGIDFREGDVLIDAPRLLTARDCALASAMNIPWLSVRRRPRVVIAASGDELVMPGEPAASHQVFGANSIALAALVNAAGGSAVMLEFVRDTRKAVAALADQIGGADVLVTTGGASVGERDFIRQGLGDRGLDLDFWRIAMRPGKPVIFGTLSGIPVLGLPGNPVSAYVCALLFLLPFIRACQGLPVVLPLRYLPLAEDLPANDSRQDHLRARLETTTDGGLTARPHRLQDSSVLSLLAGSEGLIVRPPDAPPAQAGERVPVLVFRDLGNGV